MKPFKAFLRVSHTFQKAFSRQTQPCLTRIWDGLSPDARRLVLLLLEKDVELRLPLKAAQAGKIRGTNFYGPGLFPRWSLKALGVPILFFKDFEREHIGEDRDGLFLRWS